jgi:hypothetical protein
LQKDFSTIVRVSTDEEREKASVIAALEDYENEILVKILALKGGPVWALVKRLNFYNQTVDLSYPTIALLLAVLKTYSATSGDEIDVNPLNISEENIRQVIIIADTCLTRQECSQISD